jgi:hypothetical protein
MGFSDRVDLMGQSLKSGTKNATVSFIALSLRLLTGLVLGLVLSLICQVLMNLGQFSVVFLVFLFGGIFFRVSSTWSIPKILVFDLIATLVAVILRMYIYLAP